MTGPKPYTPDEWHNLRYPQENERLTATVEALASAEKLLAQSARKATIDWLISERDLAVALNIELQQETERLRSAIKWACEAVNIDAFSAELLKKAGL